MSCKTNYDELLDGFCRACLKKYDDPGDLVHYTEKNRRLFIYSTGIQVKHNDTFTFQICKHCYLNMKNSCKFKKQCRNSDRSFKNFLRMKELGEGLDLLTFLRNRDETLKFPLLSGHSTPATQKNRDDDNESTCTSIRNFMTDILQDEEMPDNEARIIKEVIEEEADLLDDSLDSHWLLDDTVDNYSRLDFSFSPYVTPHSTEDRFSPIKQIEPSLRCKNNHAQRVFQQLPTINIDDNVKIQQYKSMNNVQEEASVKFIAAEDSITELINQNEDFILSQREEDNDINRTIVIDSESQVSKRFPLSENEIAVKSIIHELKSQENRQIVPTDIDSPVKTIDLSTFETEFYTNRDTFVMTENDVAVKSILTLNSFGNKSNDNSEFPENEHENNLAVRNLSLNDFETGSDQDIEDSTVISHTTSATKETSKLFVTKTSEVNKNEHQQLTENELAVKSIINIEPYTNKFDTCKNDKTFEPMDYETNYNHDRSKFSKSETALAVKAIERAYESECQSKNDDNPYITLEIINKDVINDQNHEKYAVVDTISLEKQVEDNLFDDNLIKGEKGNEEIVENYTVVDASDESLDVASEVDSSEKITLGDFLDSPARVYARGKGRVAGISTPTINNILFGELEDDSNHTTILTTDKTDGEDALEEFFKEGVKEFEGREYNPELPLELKYDLQNLTCKMCNRKYDKLRALQVHLGKMHKIRFPKKSSVHIKTCDICGKSVDSRNYARHVKKHASDGVKEFRCDLCMLTFTGESHWKQHMRIHNPRSEIEINKPKKYLCTTCGAKFSSSSSLAVHNRRHTDDYWHKCPTCDKGYYRRNDMEKHVRLAHTKEQPFQCQRCLKTFYTKYELGKHVRRHHTEQFTCDHCSTTFSQKNKLDKHMKKHSTSSQTVKPRVQRARPFKCPRCPLAFAKKFTLVKHLNVTACGKN